MQYLLTRAIKNNNLSLIVMLVPIYHNKSTAFFLNKVFKKYRRTFIPHFEKSFINLSKGINSSVKPAVINNATVRTPTREQQSVIANQYMFWNESSMNTWVQTMAGCDPVCSVAIRFSGSPVLCAGLRITYSCVFVFLYVYIWVYLYIYM